MVAKKTPTKKKTTASKAKKPKKAAAKKKTTSRKKKVVEEVEKKPLGMPFVTAPKVTPPKPVEEPKPAPVVKEAPKVEKKVAPKPKPAPVAKVAPPAPPSKPKTKVKKELPSYIAPASARKPILPPEPDLRKPEKKKHTEKPKKEPVPAAVQPEAPAEEKSEKPTIQFNETMTVKDLTEAMKLSVGDVIKKLLTLGTPATINQRIDFDTASLLAEAFEFNLELKSIYEEEDDTNVKEDEANLKPRCPVVTVMGHVDHGKTSLLDAIRSTDVVKGEAGGITQHIGAYQIHTEKGPITFLDTPGHEAFTAMRARGATVTDLVVLVVAADDGVKPQTQEAIDHAKAASVPIIVAINKVDLPAANIQRVKQELSQHNLLAEDWGGKTVMVEVSAKANTNIDKLNEMILLESELLELKANPNRSGRGFVLEAKMDPRRGVTATVLIQKGTLRVGDIVVCGFTYGRVRALLDDKRGQMKEAGPAVPVEILGLNKVPHVGDQLSVVNTDKEAREISERRRENAEQQGKLGQTHVSLENIHDKIEEGKVLELKVIIKADVQGSLQALQDSLGRLSNESIQLRFVHCSVGNINDSDILLAEASDSIIFGFNVKMEHSAEADLKRSGVDVRYYKIIYELLADVRAAMEGLLKPELREVVQGRARVKKVFSSSRFGAVAGCLVEEGKLVRGGKVKIMRGTEEIGKGSITNLKRFKDDVKEVEKGYECGVGVEGIKAWEEGDFIDYFVIEKHAKRLTT